MTFRFWDPRVLRAMVPAMPPDEADAFLRAVRADHRGSGEAHNGVGIFPRRPGDLGSRQSCLGLEVGSLKSANRSTCQKSRAGRGAQFLMLQHPGARVRHQHGS